MALAAINDRPGRFPHSTSRASGIYWLSQQNEHDTNTSHQFWVGKGLEYDDVDKAMQVVREIEQHLSNSQSQPEAGRQAWGVKSGNHRHGNLHHYQPTQQAFPGHLHPLKMPTPCGHGAAAAGERIHGEEICQH